MFFFAGGDFLKPFLDADFFRLPAFDPFPNVLQSGDLFPDFLDSRTEYFQGVVFFLYGGAQRLFPFSDGFFFFQFQLDGSQRIVEHFPFGANGVKAQFRLVEKAVVKIQPQDRAENFLAILRRLAGEFIRLALLEKGGIHEGAVIQTQNLIDPLLGIALAVAGEKDVCVVPVLTGAELQFAGAAFAVVFPVDLVFAAAKREGEFDEHLARVLPQQVGVGRTAVPGFAGFAPDRPGEGVEDGRFAVPVASCQAGQFKGSEIERRNVFAVR